jgi:hypothetical protein
MLQALVGSIGIFVTIPLTTYISAFLYLKTGNKHKFLPKLTKKKEKIKITEESFKENPWKV